VPFAVPPSADIVASKELLDSDVLGYAIPLFSARLRARKIMTPEVSGEGPSLTLGGVKKWLGLDVILRRLAVYCQLARRMQVAG